MRRDRWRTYRTRLIREVGLDEFRRRVSAQVRIHRMRKHLARTGTTAEA